MPFSSSLVWRFFTLVQVLTAWSTNLSVSPTLCPLFIEGICSNALNLSISPLQSLQSTSNVQNPPSLDLNNNNTNNNNANNVNENQNTNSNTNIDKTYSSQFPITPAPTDKKYEMHLKNIEKELNEADKIISQDIEPKIPLPLLNTTQNVFTAISRSIRKYVIINQNILCNLMRLA